MLTGESSQTGLASAYCTMPTPPLPPLPPTLLTHDCSVGVHMPSKAKQSALHAVHISFVCAWGRHFMFHCDLALCQRLALWGESRLIHEAGYHIYTAMVVVKL